MDQNHGGWIVRFGVFEANLKTGELRKQGIRIKLQDQPFQVLATLLEKPGEIVTREELQARLWPKDTFVDFDHSLNKAINKIRDALNDSADTPRYIETMARRGYRFIAPVQWDGADLAQAPVNPPVLEPRSEISMKEMVPPAASKWPKWIWICVLFLPVCLFLLAYFFRPMMPAPRIGGFGIKQLTHGDSQQIRWLQWGGGKLFYIELKNLRFRLMRLPEIGETGGKPEDVTPPVPSFGGWLWDASADGNRLLITLFPKGEMMMDDPVWEYDIANRYYHQIGAIQGRWFRWSPDEKKIAFLNGNDLFISDNEGRHPEKIHSFNKKPSFCSWSPDGRKLRISCPPDGDSFNVNWDINSDGTGFHQLLPHWKSWQEEGSWTLDGKYSIFASGLNLKPGGREYWALNEKTDFFNKRRPEPAQLTFGPLLLSWPAASKTGPRIFSVGFSQRGVIMRCEPKTGRRSPFLEGISADCLDFSRDGEWITYVTYPEMELWRARSDGSQRLKLVTRPMISFIPRWSPDGTRIAFCYRYRFPPGGDYWKIALVPRDGGELEKPIPETEAGHDPNWSPDGSQLVYAPHSGEASGEKAKVFILDLNTGKSLAVPGSEGFWSPRWSPDGKFLVAISPQGDLKLYYRDRKQWTALPNSYGLAYPLWSPDGKYIQGIYSPGEGPGIYRLRIPDGKREEVFDLRGINFVGNRWPWAGKTPDGDPLILEERGVSEIYALDLAY